MKKVIEDEYGETLDEVFETFDPVPIAAASIGQVYQARLRRRPRRRGQGPVPRRRHRRARRHAEPRDDPAAHEVGRARARPQGAGRRDPLAHRGGARLRARGPEPARAGAHLPRPPVHRHPRRRHRALATSASSSASSSPGAASRRSKQLPQDERDRIGEIDLPLLLRLHVPPPPVLRRPAPGQLPAARRRADGVPGLRAVQAHPGGGRRVRAADASGWASSAAASELIEHLHRGGFIGDPSYYTEDGILEQFDDFTWWYTRDEEIELTPEIATEVMIQMSDPRSRHFGKMRHETLPPDHLFGRRLEMLTLAVLGQLRAKANWHRIAREWIYGDEPVTELGPPGGRVLRAPRRRSRREAPRSRGCASLALGGARRRCRPRRRAQRLAVGRQRARLGRRLGAAGPLSSSRSARADRRAVPRAAARRRRAGCCSAPRSARRSSIVVGDARRVARLLARRAGGRTTRSRSSPARG